MTAIAASPVPRSRPLWHRAVTALVVVQGGLLWLGGVMMYTFCVARWKEVHEYYYGSGCGLPRFMLGLSDLLSADWTVTCVYSAVAVAYLALLVALWPSRWAFRFAGWLSVMCFLAWYAMLFLLAPSTLLSFVHVLHGQ